MKRLSTSSASKNIAGEPNPGFHLWTSSHGFHHLTVTQEPAWKFFWTFVLTVLTISLLGCIIYYFYYVFAFAVFSRVTQETPNVINWPVTILCDRQIFSSYKMTQMQPLTSAHVSLLTWSIHPSLTRPDFIAQGKIGQLSMDINTLMQNKFGGSYIVPGNGYGSGSGGAYGSGSGGAYGSGSGGAYGSGGGGAYGSGGGPSGGNGGGWYGGGGYGGGGYGGGGYLNGNGPYPSMDMSAPQGGPLDLLLRAIAPNCTNLILQCTFGNTSINGFDCCARYFDPVPYITQYGTCFSTRGGRMRHSVRMAGDADSFTIVTLHESSTTFYDQTIVSPKIYGANGLAFAIAADNMTVIEALNQLQTVQPGNYASVGLSKTVIDNRDLEWSAIARSKCFTPGARKSFYVDDDMLYSIDKRYGYSRGACQMISKPEMISRELLYCTFNPVQFDNLTRCNSNQSLSFYQMFQDPNIPPMMMLQRLDAKMGLRKRYQRPCRPDCYEEKFAMSPTFFPKSSADLQIYQTYATANGLGTPGGQMTPIILKLYMTSMEYQRIYNFPQPGLQFIAEIGGLMCFFLGISLVSVIECLCYCCCCGCRSDDEE